jgi:hypothetical protein
MLWAQGKTNAAVRVERLWDDVAKQHELDILCAYPASNFPGFKGAATRAAANSGPFQDFYEACVARGTKPHLARLTLARKIAEITLLVWKKGACFDAEHLKPQAA